MIIATVAAVLSYFAISNAAHGADDAPAARESQLTAAYVFNFLKFVDWPAASLQAELLVCVRGAPAVYEAMRINLESKRIGTRPVAVRAIRKNEPVDDCRALYIGKEAIQDGALLAPAETTLPLLTISDAEGFTDRGGIIELFTEDNRLRFNINVDHARRVGLRISAGLLQLAAAVDRDSR